MSEYLGFDGDPLEFRGGRVLLRWVESGGPMERAGLLLRARLRWAAFWFERLTKMTEQRCAAVVLPAKMVFIVGLWRCGSTVLHQELAQQTGWATPRTWQCFSPADFLLRPIPRERHASRPMDHGVIGTFTPQEDEFAALLLGEDSLYRAFIDPRRLEPLAGLLSAWKTPAAAEVPALSANWECFLKSVSSLHPGPLLVKSPNHTFRLPWLARRFPAAQFIWLIRRESDLLQSNRRMWSSMIRRYSLWQGKAQDLDHFLQHAMQSHDELLEWARSNVPDRLSVVPFDRVIQDREETVRQLIGRLA